MNELLLPGRVTAPNQSSTVRVPATRGRTSAETTHSRSGPVTADPAHCTPGLVET